MRTRLLFVLSAFLALHVASARAEPAVSVAVQPSIHHQTIRGWGKTSPWLPAPKLLRDQCIERAVNDLGINRLRFEGLCGNRARGQSWEWLNDDARKKLSALLK